MSTNRITRIYTRSGDGGETGLGDGSRTAKDAPRIQALGEIDETNAAIGVLLCEALPDELHQMLRRVQNELFDLGGEICIPGSTIIQEAQIKWLEESVDQLNAPLPRLKEFILPGGSRAAAQAHLARTVCRRAERAVVTLAQNESVAPCARQYLNRLSDLLFVIARSLNLAAGGSDVLWQKSDQLQRP